MQIEKLMKSRLFIFLICIMLSACDRQAGGAPTPTDIAALPIGPSAIAHTPTPAEPRILFTIPTLAPTLSSLDQEAYSLDLIASNAGCELPCILGVIPGESVWEDLRKLHAPISYREKYEPDDSGHLGIALYANQELFNNLEMTFFGSPEHIERISLDARIYRSEDPYHFPLFSKAMQRYDMPAILSKYGVPSRILLQVQPQLEQEGGTVARIFPFYDDRGILVEYLYEDVIERNTQPKFFTVCPVYKNIHSINVFGQSPENALPLERMIGDENDYFLKFTLNSLGEITDLNTEDFYKIFTAPDGNGCFETS